MYTRQRRWEQARETLKRSLAGGPTYSALVNLGNIEYLTGRFADAASTYDAALRLNSKDYRVWGSWAQAMRLAGRKGTDVEAGYRRAAQLAEESSRLNPADARAMSLRSIYAACLGDTHAARLAIEDALAQPSATQDTMVDAAITYTLIGDHARAREWSQRALAAGYDPEELRNDPDLRAARL